ncbi:efflux RND transporter permease subunit [Cytophagaceae bacterium ABcell3]|nr:efflux RND transporter permease subunit [Cytophagaceae bacterium ABcell3]
MRSLIAHFIRYPVLGNTLMLLMFVFGYLGFTNLKKSFFPERETRMIEIQTTFPGASPEEVEEGIVQKIEDNLKGLTGVERVSSVSSENSGIVSVEVIKGYDTDKVLQDVKNAVDRISSFPTGMEPPVIFEVENLSFAISFALSGDVDLKTLKTYAERIEDDLMGVEGISKVDIKGYPQEEIEIGFRENDLRKFNLTFQEVSDVISKSNIEVTGGTVKGMREEFLVRARAKGYYAEEFKNIIVKTTQDGSVIRLQDVAEVTGKWEDNPGRNYLNGNPAVVITINNTLNEDVMFITGHVKQFIEDFNTQNTVVQATIIQDQSLYLNQRINLLSENGIVGFLLVLILLSMFLHIRLAFWVAISIPISFAGMFILAAIAGITINVISLFGMILVIGILVDDGIVISENIYQHFEKGKSAVQAAVDGTMDVLPSVFAAILTTVTGFSLFFFMDGRMGEIMTDMAFVVIATLLISLIEAVFILPAHIAHSKALKREGNKPNWLQRQFTNFMNFLKDNLYAPALRFSLNNKFLVFSILTGLLLVTFGAIKGSIIRSTFFPSIERDKITVSLSLPAGTRESVTEHWLTHIEEATWRVNEQLKKEREDNKDVILAIEKVLSTSSHEGSLNIIMLDGETRGTRDYVISNAIREEAGPIPGAEKLSYGTDSPWGKPVSVALLGYDKKQLNSAKEELKAELQSMTSLRDIVDNDQPGLKEISLTLKPKAYLLGLQLQDVIGQVRQGFFGSEVQRLQRGKDEVRIWVRYKEQERKSLDDLAQMRIRLPDGKEYPLEEIAEFSIERGVTAINHLDGFREIKLEADVADPNAAVSDIILEIQNVVVPAILARYPDVKASFEGQSRETAKMSKSIAKAGLPILLIMIALIAVTFRSYLQAAIVVITIPYAIIGVGWGHFIHDAPISSLSAYGIIALIGVLVNDSLVLINTVNNNLKEGMGFRTAVYEGSVSRFRPILLTSITTIAGLGPLIIEKSLQAQFLIPMGISIAYGLVISTVLMLILLPVFLVFFNNLRVYIKWLWEGKKPSSEEVEPAVKELQVLE